MQDRAEATRRAVLAAAAREFDRSGYAAAGVADIATRAGCTSGALYFHFTGKDGLAAAVIEAHFAAWKPLTDRAQALRAPAVERLVALSIAVMRAFRDDVIVRAGARLWTERHMIDATLPPPFIGWITLVTRMLEQAGTEGDLAPRLDPGEAADALVCALFGIHTVSDVLDGRDLIEDHLRALWLLLLPGLLGRPGDYESFLDHCRALADTLTPSDAPLPSPR